MEASLRSDRSSAARASTLEVLKQLLGGVDDRIRLLALEILAIVDASPRDGEGAHAGGARRAHVERRVADVRADLGRDAHPLGRNVERLRIGLVALGLVAAHDRVEEVAERD